MKKKGIYLLIGCLAVMLVLCGINAAWAAKWDVEHASKLKDKALLEYVNSLGLKGQEVIDFFKSLPVSKANKEVYKLFQKEGFQFYHDKYPSAPPFGGYQWKMGMGEEVTCPLGKYPLKYLFDPEYVPLAPGPVGDPNKTYRLGYTIHGWEHPWLLNNTGCAINETNKHPNVKITTLDAGWDDAKQAKHVDTWVAQGFDGILIWPRVEAPTGPPVDRAIDAGIPVVSVDRQVGTDRVSHRITGNFPANGIQCAVYLVHRLIQETGEPKANIIMIRQSAGSSPDVMRTGYFLRVVSYFPGIKILKYYHNLSSQGETFKQVQDALMAYPNLDAMFFDASSQALGAAEAIGLAKRWKSREGGRKIILVAPDDGHDSMHAIREGHIDANPPYVGFLGGLGVRIVLRHIMGEDLPQDITTPDLIMVTKEKENVFGIETYTADEWEPYCYGPQVK